MTPHRLNRGKPLIGVIVDNLRLAAWEADSLRNLAGDFEFLVLNCTNTRRVRRPVRHFAYYCLNILSLRSRLTRSVPLPGDLDLRSTLSFEAEMDGNWQRLPEHIVELLNEENVSVVVKFGMGLLRIPERLRCPILSYHHGDPRRYRGRPAGFYEMLAGEPVVGQIVQILSNRLDSGRVVAFAETRVVPYSYRATMQDAYARSPLLLRPAISNAMSGRTLPIEPEGKNWRLPSNRTVARFAARSAASKTRHLAYGLFFEKRWQVARSAVAPDDPEAVFRDFPAASRWSVVDCPPAYRFIADPFPHPGGGVLVEALRRSDNQGEILLVDGPGKHVVCTDEGHFSYPSVIEADGKAYLLPETSEWSRPKLFELGSDGASFVAELDLERPERLVDPTIYRAEDGRLYLFANTAREGSEVLRLWHSEELFGRFVEHVASPIRISPHGSRMAGALVRSGAQTYRIGQDGSRSYGDGVSLFRIDALSPSEYLETAVGSLRLHGKKGPHTLNFAEGTAVFDFYEDKFTALAWFNRIQARYSKWRALRRAPADRAPAQP